jgi:hypothetical protein
MGDLCVEATGPTVYEINAELDVALCLAIFDVIEAMARFLCEEPSRRPAKTMADS